MMCPGIIKNENKIQQLKKLESNTKDTWIQIRVNSEFKKELKQQMNGKKLSEFIIDAIFEHLEVVNTIDEAVESKKPDTLYSTDKSKEAKKYIKKQVELVKQQKKLDYDFFLPCKKCGKMPCECDK